MFIFVYTGDTLISAIRRGIGLNVLMGTTPIAFNKRCACFTSNNLFVVVVVGCRTLSSQSINAQYCAIDKHKRYVFSVPFPPFGFRLSHYICAIVNFDYDLSVRLVCFVYKLFFIVFNHLVLYSYIVYNGNKNVLHSDRCLQLSTQFL